MGDTTAGGFTTRGPTWTLAIERVYSSSHEAANGHAGVNPYRWTDTIRSLSKNLRRTRRQAEPRAVETEASLR